MRCCGDYAIFEEVAGGEAEDADGFDADVVVGGGVDYGGIGLVGDGTGKNVDGAAAGVGDAHEREFDLLERAVVVEGQAGELAGAEFVVDVHAGVDFLAAVAIGLEAHAGFEELDLCGELGGGFLGAPWRHTQSAKREYCTGESHGRETMHWGLVGSLGRG